MTVCLNPTCAQPENVNEATHCQNCGTALFLGNRYRAIRLIGQGGFGRTFLAIDQTLDQNRPTTEPVRYCVIKQLLPRSLVQDSRSLQHWFQQEVDQLVQLGQHPQIPRLLDHIETETSPYLIQEFIPGKNLETVLTEQGPLTEAHIRQLLADILPVLRFVHQHQVVHRDVKPANIIAPDSGAPYALVDFGAAKRLPISGGAQTGTTIGSAGYAAPEQAMGKAEFASDLYGLGVTCIHLLTGVHPFDLYSVGEDRWVWRSFLTQPVSVELRRVLDKLIQRPTRQRYQTASEVLYDLRLESRSDRAARTVINAVTATTPATPTLTTAAQRSTPLDVPWFCRQTLTGHQGEVTALAFSPNGAWFASGSTDKTIKLWNLAGELLYTWSGKSLRFPQGHQARITALQFSPNSEILVSSSADSTIKQWNLNTGELFNTLPGQGWGISAIALSAKEPLLISGSEDGLLQLWDLATERLITNLVQLTQPISSLVIDPTGSTVWSSSGKSICQWDLSTDRLLATLKGHAATIRALALRCDNCTLISSGDDKLVKLWNLNTGQQQKVIAAHRDRVTALAIHPTEALFASASADSTLKLWNLWTGDRLCTLRHNWSVNAIGFSRDGSLLVSGSADETIKIWQSS